MGLLGVFEAVALADRHGDGAVRDGVKQFSCAPAELVGRAGVVHQRRSGQEQRARGVEPLRVERRDRTAGGAEQRQRAADREAGDAGVECVGADAVVDRGNAAVGEFLDPGAERGGVVGVVEHLHRARLA